MTNYFSHDFNARNDIRLQNLVMKMGYEGLGFYWCVVEMLYEQDGKIELEQCTSIAFALHTDVQKINELIDIVFEKDSKYFWSESVLKRLKVQKEISKVRKNAAKKKWENEAKKSSTPLRANGMQMQSKSNAIKEKESKVKEIKENNNIAPVGADDLNDLIALFKGVNPNFDRLYANKSQREALDRQVKRFGYEKLERLLLDLPRIIALPYSPQITTPVQLENKMGDLIQFLNKEKNKSVAEKPKIAVMGGENG